MGVPFVQRSDGVRRPRRAVARTRRAILTAWHCPSVFACWIREGYPEWAPRHGHVALVAMCGRDGSLINQRPRPAH